MLSQSYSTTTKRSAALSSLLANKRLLLPMLICLALLFEPLRTLTIATLADAFFQVSVFVAGTLAIYYFLIDRLPQLELSYLKAKSPLLEISMAAILGALPGCGGAIIVVTQFTKGQASFASVVAVLTATMGDAAFLLLAKKPLEGLTIIALGVAVGVVSGLVVNMLHKPEFCQPSKLSRTAIECKTPSSAIRFSEPVWRWVLLPCVVIALLIAFNADLGILTKPVELAGAALALFALTIWALSSKGQSYREVTAEDDEQDPPSKLAKVIHDTHFVTAWVVASFMLYELSVALFGLDLAAWFSEYAVFAPLIAIAIGMLPGCGPQIVVTSLYIQGVLPFNALAANAIANDGDALFPALALAPGAAAMATLYSAIPALLVGYGLYYFS
ncbi:putative manganese transporter [Pseudoalteromonas viridis]|uniref:Arsenic efflux protein n=1 Tax=Pseudoalteromonas viridis TaxID=339617 RepID=A0ABX7V8E2_9GAMM|nr:putative manganese transporter [Pseudoalteromonas viridis]QTL34774.1 arsenic efflux protein [Pseudoalteromonas viridis]